jgi:hypothetical protein
LPVFNKNEGVNIVTRIGHLLEFPHDSVPVETYRKLHA